APDPAFEYYLSQAAGLMGSPERLGTEDLGRVAKCWFGPLGDPLSVSRDVITDEIWELIRDMFPPARTRGRPPVDRRTVVEATAWRFRTGSAWRYLPDRFGSWNTIYKNLRRWASDGGWEDLLTHVQKRASLAGEIDWVVSVDSSIARVHQHGATLPRVTGGSVELQEVRARAS